MGRQQSPGMCQELAGAGAAASQGWQLPKVPGTRRAATPLGNGNGLRETFHKYPAAGGTPLTSRPSSAELRIPHAVITAGVGGTNQVPSSDPLGKCYFQLILPKLDMHFAGCSRCACTYQNPKPRVETQSGGEGVRQPGSAGRGPLLIPTPSSRPSPRQQGPARAALARAG